VDKLSSILVVSSRTDADRVLLEKAVLLARKAGAQIHLFSCDAALAKTLRHAYPSDEAEKAWNISQSEHLAYLQALRTAAHAPDVQIDIEAACCSPLHEGIAGKAAQMRVDLIMKSPSGAHPLRRFAFDANDWHLVRECPATLMLVGQRPWRTKPQFAAMVDVSEDVTVRLAEMIIHTSEYFSLGCRGELDVIYSERSSIEPERSERAATLQRLTREYRIESARVHVLNGEPETTLADFAAHRQYDAVILGGRTHRKGLAPLVGTLTSKLVETLDSDFILVKRARQISEP
jgi:universal stress protein E